MSINLVPKLTQQATKYATTRNQYGDDVFGATTTMACLYRDISDLSRGNSNREEVNIDGLLWFGPSVVINKADIFSVNSQFYRVERVIVARDRLRTNTIKFYKCEVSKTRQVS